MSIHGLLLSKGHTVADVEQDTLFVDYLSKEQMGEINTLLNQKGYVVYSIMKVQKDLENLFLDITQKAGA